MKICWRKESMPDKPGLPLSPWPSDAQGKHALEETHMGESFLEEEITALSLLFYQLHLQKKKTTGRRGEQ